MKIIIAGAGGFIGKALTNYLLEKKSEVIPITRSRGKEGIFWDPEKKIIDTPLLEKADVIINLAGEPITGRWTKKKKERIEKSRIQATEVLCDAIKQLSYPPSLYIGASAIGFYGDRKEETLTESSPPGEGFLPSVCIKWEQVAEERLSGIRSCFARFGVVMGLEGGAFKKMLPAYKWAVAGPLGSGKQTVSWIAIEDVCGAIDLLCKTDLSGPINFTTPFPLTNREMTRLISKYLHRPAPFSVPEGALSLLFGEGASIFLMSTKALPEKLTKAGYQFQCPTFESFLQKKYLAI